MVRKAAKSNFESDFDWITDKEALRVTSDPANRGLTAIEVRELAREWVLNGGEISCVEEQREGYRDRRHFHYDIIVLPLDGFPNGRYIYMEICNADEDAPAVNLLNAHPPRSR